MVVGVVADTKLSALDAETDPAMYVSIWQLQRPRPNIAYVIRTSVDSGSLASAVREQIREIDPDLPVYQLTTMHQTVSESVSQRRFAMFLLTVFALSAMLLAAIGLYGVISYSAEQRNHEIGIRVALGAKRWDILKLVVGQGMGLAFLGIAIGFVAAWGMTHFIQDLLFGISPTDPITFIGVAGLLTAAAFIACFIPALKAIQNDPIVILRNN